MASKMKMQTKKERRTMASRRERGRINPKHQSGHVIPKDSIRYDGHGGRGSHSDGDSDIPLKWSGCEKMICMGEKFTPPKKNYCIDPYADVDVKAEVESVEDGKKTAICVEVPMMTVGFTNVASGPEMIPGRIDVTLRLKGDAARHCVDRPIMEPNTTPTVNALSRSATKSANLPVDIRRAGIAYARTTGASTSKPTFTWRSVPFETHDSISARYRMKVETDDVGERIVPGTHFGSVPKLPLEGHGFTPLSNPGSSLCKARWICHLPTNPKTVELSIEVKLRPTIFRAWECMPCFYSVTEGHPFIYNKDLTFTRPE